MERNHSGQGITRGADRCLGAICAVGTYFWGEVFFLDLERIEIDGEPRLVDEVEPLGIDGAKTKVSLGAHRIVGG